MSGEQIRNSTKNYWFEITTAVLILFAILNYSKYILSPEPTSSRSLPWNGHVIYALAKYLGYSLWCYVFISRGEKTYSSRQIATSLIYGGVRWLLGLLFGAGVFLFMSNGMEPPNLKLYTVAVYIPIRFAEWFIVLHFLSKKTSGQGTLRREILWICGGIALSFLIDLISPEMAVEHRFCFGRCLC